MKAITYAGKEKLILEERNVPQINVGEALVKVNYGGICGTDMMIYAGVHPRAQSGLVMGHEFSGEISEIKGQSSFEKGDRVAINPIRYCGECEPCKSGNYHICENLKYIGIDLDGGFAEYAKIPIENLHILSNHVREDEAAVIEPLAVAIHTVRRSKFKVGDVVTILGAGPIGILIGIIAKLAGAAKVIISDISSYRLEVAASYGLHTVNSTEKDLIEEVKSITKGIGSDVVFEAAGNQITADQMISAIKTQGEIMVVSVFKNSPTIDLAKMHFRELSLSTTRCFSPRDFEAAIQFIEEGRINIEGLISHRLPVESFEEGFQLVKKSAESLKVLFKL
ncbi:zinc-dependent alcohol dehydrogenase [Oceanobacillus timonensis]|uniref:zinc-dependent alcohol dehydrogenase n=1 Tax=Oceanobacillus timonensis TaxID=1926285 RepID=UPI0009BA41D0|nr:alcohol dehydrogenase catalytic domain-containing protein [Oceanobacillus timonensis]